MTSYGGVGPGVGAMVLTTPSWFMFMYCIGCVSIGSGAGGLLGECLVGTGRESLLGVGSLLGVRPGWQFTDSNQL